jgi:hypothetical protein
VEAVVIRGFAHDNATVDLISAVSSERAMRRCEESMKACDSASNRNQATRARLDITQSRDLMAHALLR